MKKEVVNQRRFDLRIRHHPLVMLKPNERQAAETLVEVPFREAQYNRHDQRQHDENQRASQINADEQVTCHGLTSFHFQIDAWWQSPLWLLLTHTF